MYSEDSNENQETPKQHITRLFFEKGRNDTNSTTLANSLESTITSALKGGQKFIFELLQNADDAGVQDQPVAVKFTYIPAQKATDTCAGYLIFSHDGEHFSKTDVAKITDYAQQFHQDKSSDSNKTGYKNIGFKSIFSISDHVIICSKDYRFEFNKHSKHWQKSVPGRLYPWQITPIYTEEDDIPYDAFFALNQKDVNFIIAVKPGNFIEDELKFILKETDIFLFLRRIKKLEVNINNVKTVIEFKKNVLGELFYVNEKLTSLWLKYEATIPVTNEMRQTLVKMGEHECPQRLKQAKETRVIFAALVGGDYVIQKTQGRLFCVLPTQLYSGFPFLVNGDFLLKPDRAQFQESTQATQWNTFLFKQIALFQFTWLAKLAQFELQTGRQPFRRQILKLIAQNYPGNLIPLFSQQFLIGFNEGIQKTAFIPEHKNPKKLLVVNEASLDVTGFSKHMDAYLSSWANYVDPLLEDLHILESRNDVAKFYPNGVCQYLPGLVKIYHNLAFYQKLFAFLMPKVNDYSWRQHLVNTMFVLTQQGKFVKPSELYFPADTTSLPVNLDVNYVHPDLLKIVGVKEFLIVLGARVLTLGELVKGPLLMLINGDQITVENIVPITQLIFKAFQAGHIHSNDWKLFENLFILTKGDRLISIKQAYLADEFLPPFLFEKKVTENDIFVSLKYFGTNLVLNNNTKTQWRDFFINLGVLGDIKFFSRESYYTEDAQEEKGSIMTNYISYLGNQIGQLCNEDYFSSFLDCTALPYLHDAEIAKIFWKKVLLDWWQIRNNQHNEACYINGYYKKLPLTYLQYVVMTTTCIPDATGKMYKPTELYIGKLLGFKWSRFLMANPELDLTEEQAVFFGFKTKLTLKDCLGELLWLNQAKVTSNDSKMLNCYGFFLGYLLKIQLGAVELQQLRTAKVKLPAQNGELKEISQLCCFGIKEKPAPANSTSWLREFSGITRDNLLKIGSLFGIKIITEKDLRFKAISPEPDEATKAELERRLSAIVRVEAHAKNLNEKELLKTLTEKLKPIIFVKAKSLAMTYIEDESLSTPVFVYLEGNKFYFKNAYNHPSTLEAFCEELSRFLSLSPQTKKLLQPLLFTDNLQETLVENNYSSDNLPSLLNTNTLVNSGIASDIFDMTAMFKKTQISESKDQSQPLTPSSIANKPNESLLLTPKSITPTQNFPFKAPTDNIFRGKNNNWETSSIQTDQSSSLFGSPATPLTKTKSSFPIPATPSQNVDTLEFSEEVEPDKMLMQQVNYKNRTLTPIKTFSAIRMMPEESSQTTTETSFPTSATSIFFQTPLSKERRPIYQEEEEFARKSTTPQLSGTAKKAIGDWGENFVYEYLKWRYLNKYSDKNKTSPKKKYSNTKFAEARHGAFGIKFSLSAVDESGTEAKLELIWNNRYGESKLPYDLMIVKKGVEHIIEVKATPSSTKNEIDVTENEIVVMHQHKERYRFLRVYDAGKSTAHIEKIKNPSKKLKNDELKIVGMKIRL